MELGTLFRLRSLVPTGFHFQTMPLFISPSLLPVIKDFAARRVFVARPDRLVLVVPQGLAGRWASVERPASAVPLGFAELPELRGRAARLALAVRLASAALPGSAVQLQHGHAPSL